MRPSNPLLPELQILSLTVSTMLEVLKHCLCTIIYKILLFHPIHNQQLLTSNLLGICATGMLTPIWRKEGLLHSKCFKSVTACPLQEMACLGGQPHYQCNSPSILAINSHQTPAVTHLHCPVISAHDPLVFDFKESCAVLLMARLPCTYPIRCCIV